MKMSDAVELGSTVVKASPGYSYDAETKTGCAIGMAAVAVGATFTRVENAEFRRTSGIENVWDWTRTVVIRPCSCPNEYSVLGLCYLPAKDAIAHLFDHHVYGKQDWTLDKLISWIRANEPDEAPPQSPIQSSSPLSIVCDFLVGGESAQQQLEATQQFLKRELL